MRRYATLRRCATLKHKVLSGDASWKYFRFERRIASQRRIASHISKIPFLTFLTYDIAGSSLLIFYLYLHKILIYSFSHIDLSFSAHLVFCCVELLIISV